jgi:hypothetical protein
MDVSEDSEFHVLGTGKRGLSRERGGAAMQGNFPLDFPICWRLRIRV